MSGLMPDQLKPAAEWIAALAGLGVFREHEAMARHTTLGVGGPARWFFRPSDRDALVNAIELCPADVSLLALGRGSNILIPDSGLNALVVDLSDLNALLFDGCSVHAGAGVRMSRFARLCAEHGLSGGEFLATVPGDIGGGVAMNAGAFAQQLSDTLVNVDLLLRSGEVVRMDANALMMSYRHSELPEQSLVLGASFSLYPDSPDQIRERMRTMRSRRSATQPLSLPNCGSVFKNPQGDHAARLIEAAGLKGFAIGGARISEQHANFIVNTGEASSADIAALIVRAQREVKAQFDISLEPEVRMPGEWQ
ncbi:MAG: UDP-N-acetylmuramate dehydrogenase [Mariprofundus sp.]